MSDMSSSPSSSPKKLLFKEFANDHRSRLSEKYPFLTNQQIQAKLKQLWKKVCQDNKEMAKNNQSPRKGKSSNPVENKKSPGIRKHLSWNLDSRGSPLKSISENGKSLGSPVSPEVDSGPWYDEMTADSLTGSPRKSQENFTEETVKNVIDHELNIEEQENSHQEESTIVKTEAEAVLSGLFPSTKLSLENEELGTRQSSRLLSSQEEEGDSNFNLMFDEGEKIFL